VARRAAAVPGPRPVAVAGRALRALRPGRLARLDRALGALRAVQQPGAVRREGDGLPLALEGHAQPALALRLAVVPGVVDAAQVPAHGEVFAVRGERGVGGPQVDRDGPPEDVGARRGQLGGPLVQVPALLVLVDEVDAPRLRVHDHRLGVPRAVGVRHHVLRGPQGLVLELLRLGQLVDPYVGPGPAEVVAAVPDEDPVAGADGDGLHVAGRADAGERDPGDGLPARAVDGVQVGAVVAVVVRPVDAGV